MELYPERSLTSTLTDLIHRNGLLATAPETVDVRVAFERVLLADTAVDAFPLMVEATAIQFFTHQGNHIGLRKTEWVRNRFEGGPVLPGHFDDPVDGLLIGCLDHFKIQSFEGGVKDG